MIQRIQSILLFLAGLITGGLIIDPVQLASIHGSNAIQKMGNNSVLADGIFHIKDHILLLVMVGLNVLIVFVAIFMFKNRKIQLALARIGIALSFLFLVLSSFLFYQAYQLVPDGTELSIEFGVLIPILEIIILILAIRFISKDDKLVKSMDRLR